MRFAIAKLTPAGAGSGLRCDAWLCAVWRRSALAVALTLGLLGPATAQATFLGSLGLDVPTQPRFGGLSAIEVLPGGRTAIALSDRGTLFGLSLTRTNGRITGAGLTSIHEVRGPGGQSFAVFDRDAEGLARLPGGGLVISFEGSEAARLARHGANGVELQRYPPPPGAGSFPRNGAFEGLAVDRQGRLYTLPEDMPGRGPIPLLRFDGSVWQLFAELPRARGWSPVALDFDDRGRLYVLERRSSAASFATRMTRYAVGTNGVGNAERLLETSSGTHGNLEGLSVWRNGAGQLVATMVSDDNFSALLRTAIVEYVVAD